MTQIHNRRLHEALRAALARMPLLVCVLLLASAVARAQFNGPTISLPQAGSPMDVTTDRSLLYPQSLDMRLSAGDQLAVRLLGQPEYAPIVMIDVNGTVSLPYLGVLHLQGLTVTQAEEAIANGLRDAGIYRDPQVTLQLTAGPSATATVVGEVHGVVPIVGSRTLLQVLATTGLPATASHVLTINRPGVDKPLIVDLGHDPTQSAAANIPIFAGDVIVVSRIGVVYVVGAFKNQGAIPLNNYGPLTLTQATALSGGPAYEGKYNDLHLIRTNGNQRTVVTVDIKRVMYGKDPDPILQPNDIVFLPQSALKSSISNGSLGTILGVASVAYAIILSGIQH